MSPITVSPSHASAVICSMDLNAHIYPDDAAGLGVSNDCTPTGLCVLLSAIWLWLGMVSRRVLGQGLIHGDTPPTPVVSPTINRAQRRLYNHHPNSPLPPSRNLSPFYRFGPPVSATQFLERLCRLSVSSRIRIYGMSYALPRDLREAVLAMFTAGDFQKPCGLCDAHIAPD